MGLFDRLKHGLTKTREMLFTDVRDLFKAGRRVDDAFLDELEAKLIRTDMGVAAAGQVVDRVRTNFLNGVGTSFQCWIPMNSWVSLAIARYSWLGPPIEPLAAV